MKLIVELTKNKYFAFLSPQGFQLLGGRPACRDGFTQICNLIFPRPLREGVNVWGWLVSSTRPLWEREKPFMSCKAKVTDSGEGSTQEFTQTAPHSEGKLFSDTLPLCSRYRFEKLPLAPFRLNLASVVFPRHPIPECVMLNLFQHLTGLNSSKIEWETNTHNNIIKTDFLRFQDDNAYTTPRPLSTQLRKDHSRPMCHVILSPITIQGRRIPKTYFVILSPLSIWGRRISKTLQKGDSSGFRPQNDGTLVTLASPRPLGERVEFQVERERNLEIRVWGGDNKNC